MIMIWIIGLRVWTLRVCTNQSNLMKVPDDYIITNGEKMRLYNFGTYH